MSRLKGFFKEFETFAIRGNAIDLAVGVVIGAAFNQITTALSTNVLTPFVGLALGGYDFSKLSVTLGGNATVSYGVFLEACLNFILIAFALFLLVKVINRLTRKKKEEAKKPAENPELKVLMEIRDELKRSTI
ncbi:MAG TPA: large conductance mechanosensitive channel protein MscL [Candidatus Paceibacterota bacterium]|nr:large conductance mechanosensitive channel protein MscL [Candidatus Paceibacterota bacterium]